jgi:hypothetical protein
MQPFCKFLATTTVSFLASSGAYAQTAYEDYGPLPPNPPKSWIAEGRSIREWDRFRYDYSGTRGRMASAPIRPIRRVPVIFPRRAGRSCQFE